MLKNKKSLTLPEAITMALAVVIIVLGVLPFWDRVYAAFFGEKDDGSLENYEGKLVPKIKDLLSNNRKSDYREINYYLGTSKWILIGFKKGAQSEHKIPMQAGVSIKKPAGCGDKACICLFNAGDEGKLIRGDVAKPCIILNSAAYLLKDFYLANYGENTEPGNTFYLDNAPDIFKNEKYKYLILASTLGTSSGILGSSSSSVALYIEKYTNQNNEVTLYFAPINDNTRNKINERKRYIDSQNKI